MITKKQLARLRQVQDRVQKEANSHSGDRYARALAYEGYAGGYIQAIRDIELYLSTGIEPDTRGYWRDHK